MRSSDRHAALLPATAVAFASSSSSAGALPAAATAAVAFSPAAPASAPPPPRNPPGDAQADAEGDALAAYKADGGSVVALVFAGRRRYLRLLWPRLLRARSAGRPGGGNATGEASASASAAGAAASPLAADVLAAPLDAVVLVANTRDGGDLAWLRAVAASAPPGFAVLKDAAEIAVVGRNGNAYCRLYGGVPALAGTDPARTLVLKLDDDIVWLEKARLAGRTSHRLARSLTQVVSLSSSLPLSFAPSQHALGRLAAAKLARPGALLVSANVVNHPLLAHVHLRTGLLGRPDAEAAAGALGVPLDRLPPYPWSFPYHTFSGEGWSSAPHALLHHVLLAWRVRTLSAARARALYASAFREWDFDATGGGDRWSVNAIAFDAADLGAAMDVAACGREADDEHYLTAVLPRLLGRRCVAASAPLVAHGGYGPQRVGGLDDDTLLRLYSDLE